MAQLTDSFGDFESCALSFFDLVPSLVDDERDQGRHKLTCPVSAFNLFGGGVFRAADSFAKPTLPIVRLEIILSQQRGVIA
jgi:hypothetical protein